MHEAPGALDRDGVPFRVGAVDDEDLGPLRVTAEHLVLEARAGAQVHAVSGQDRLILGRGRYGGQRKQQARDQEQADQVLSHMKQILFLYFQELSE